MKIRQTSTVLAILAIILNAVYSRANAPRHEMRGAWVATIYGLDWPKTRGVDKASMEQQKKEMDDLLDRLQHTGCNAVMFQARTFSDAMYPSDLEPWAVALTGERGAAPVAGWDPLKYVVEQSHRRGMECHAWINPFRYSTSATPYKDRYDKERRNYLISHTQRPKSRREKAKVTTILDPGNQQAREHVVKVCRDILTRYDVDGLIFDDYFYPDRLPLAGGYDYNEWKHSGTKLSQADWRRENVNNVLREVYEMVKHEKPWVSFGVSPAGVGGGNGVSASRYGLDACTGNDWMYDRIFCDPLAWMSGGYIDYISPQIYWARDHKTNPYGELARWWATAADRLGCDFFASHSLSSMAQHGGNTPDAWHERGCQIEINRSESTQRNHAPGSILYAARNMMEFGDHLASNQWSLPALPVGVKTAAASSDRSPVTGLSRTGNNLSWQPKEPTVRYAIFAIPAESALLDVIQVEDGLVDRQYLQGFTYYPKWSIPKGMESGFHFIVVPFDRAGKEHEPAII